MEFLILGGLAILGLVSMASKEAGETKGWRDAMTHFEQKKQDEELMRTMMQYFGGDNERDR